MRRLSEIERRILEEGSISPDIYGGILTDEERPVYLELEKRKLIICNYDWENYELYSKTTELGKLALRVNEAFRGH